MAASASSRGFTAPIGATVEVFPTSPNGFVEFRRKKRSSIGGFFSIQCCCSDSVMPIRGGSGSGNGVDKGDDGRLDSKKITANYMRTQASSPMPFASPQSRFVSKPEKFFSRCTPRNSGPKSRDSPPKRDTGIANEKDWGISMLNDSVNETGVNEDGSTWYRESGEDLGDNGYRCRWTRMGGQSSDGTLEWKETVLRNLGKMLKGTHGGKHGGKFFTKMNGVILLGLKGVHKNKQNQALRTLGGMKIGGKSMMQRVGQRKGHTSMAD
ncbi:hypothetical protein AABB24_008738 [Solanum stoloniferum]|uniref:Uncharacterized protein n=1 Tax=Solanum stoloniferum TaxID=62892 RepID=A0ABD2UU29_9SOLN